MPGQRSGRASDENRDGDGELLSALIGHLRESRSQLR